MGRASSQRALAAGLIMAVTLNAFEAVAVVTAMVGRHIETPARVSRIAGTDDLQPLLRVEKLSIPGRLDAVSLNLDRGEVLGITGLAGSGLAELTKAIDSLIQTGHAPYPVERTLLTTGILDAVMTSRHEKGKRIETPHLEIKYTPTEWGGAKGEIPKAWKK